VEPKSRLLSFNIDDFKQEIRVGCAEHLGEDAGFFQRFRKGFRESRRGKLEGPFRLWVARGRDAYRGGMLLLHRKALWYHSVGPGRATAAGQTNQEQSSN